MEFSLLALIGISLAAMFFGYFFGLFEGRGQGYKRRRREEARDRQVFGASDKTANSEPKEAEGGPEQNPGHERLALEADDHGRARLRLDGRHIAPDNVAAHDRKRLIELMVMLKPWIDTGAGAAPPQPARPPRPSLADRLGSAANPDDTTTAARAAPAPPSPALPTQTSLSMVSQIDVILQNRLAGTPLAKRGIRLAESPHGGAAVYVGLTQYGGVGDVPDPEIQAAIRAAIAEWERTATSGGAA